MKLFVVKNIILSIVLNNLLIFGSQKCCVCCCKNKSTLHDNSTTNEINSKKKPIINKKTKISKKDSIYNKHKSKQKKDNLKKSDKYNLVVDKKNIINKSVYKKSLVSNSEEQNTENININEHSVEENSREHNNFYNFSLQENNLDKCLCTIKEEDCEDSEDSIINNGTDLNSCLENINEDDLDKIINKFFKECSIKKKYKIIKKLQEGGFAKVFLASNVETNEKVAIKKIDKSSLNEKRKKRLFKEFYILYKITKSYKYKNVQDIDRNNVTLIETCQDEENYYIIQEYCEYGDLCEYYIYNNAMYAKLTDNDVACYFYQLINGVEYLHSLGIVHRDLKLENLLLNDKFILKICDFGLSTFFDNKSPLLKSLVGTLVLVAPELLESKSYDGEKADIFSCGLVLYMLKYGDYPFNAQHAYSRTESEEDRLRLIKQIKDKSIKYYNNFDEEFKILMDGMLEYDPKKRISIDKIKNSDFYLRGKKIFNEKYKCLKT